VTKRLAVAATSVFALALAASPAYAADGASPVTFWSGQGAQSHWQNHKGDSPNDTDTQDIELATTDRFSWYGYAGFSVANLDPTRVEDFGPSTFEVKSDYTGGSLGSPRLVVQFSDGGSADLRPLQNNEDWQTVGDGAEWDNHGGTCDFGYEETWAQVRDCHLGENVTGVFMVADAYGHTHWIDNLDTAAVTFDGAPGNGN
jgi:opacity protein-like surface antigen